MLSATVSKCKLLASTSLAFARMPRAEARGASLLWGCLSSNETVTAADLIGRERIVY